MPAVRSDIGTIPWPDQFPYRGTVIDRVVDPMADRLTDGDNVFGWGGDNRVALFASLDLGLWFLMRYDEDRQFRVLCVKPMADVPTADVVGIMLLHLLLHDSRRVDVFAEASKVNAKAKDDNAAALESWAEEEGGPRLASVMLREMDR